MRKVKIEERLENAANAFFDVSDEKNAGALVFANNSALLQTPEKATFTAKAESWANIARQVLLFLPGAFLLYISTLVNIFFSSHLGFTFPMLFWILASSFFCWIGLGSLRNKKNLLIPFSIFLFAAFLGVLFSLFSGATQYALIFNRSLLV